MRRDKTSPIFRRIFGEIFKEEQEAKAKARVKALIEEPTQTAEPTAEAPATTAWRQRGARSSREDIAMLDYSSASSRAISSITGMSFEHSKQPSMATPMEDEEYTQLLENVTPTKAPSTVVKSRKKNAAEKNVIWIRPDADAIKGSAEVKKVLDNAKKVLESG